VRKNRHRSRKVFPRGKKEAQGDAKKRRVRIRQGENSFVRKHGKKKCRKGGHAGVKAKGLLTSGAAGAYGKLEGEKSFGEDSAFGGGPGRGGGKREESSERGRRNREKGWGNAGGRVPGVPKEENDCWEGSEVLFTK